jgi:hypothetical protein
MLLSMEAQRHVEDKVQLVVPVPKSLQKQLKVAAVIEDRSLKDVVIQAVTEYLGRHRNLNAFRAAEEVQRTPLSTATSTSDSWRKYKTPGKGRTFDAARKPNGDYVLDQSGSPRIDAEFIQTILTHFASQTVIGGFNMTNPPRGGFGDWVDKNSAALNSRRLTPRHACFLAGILVEDAGIEAFLDGPHDRVMLRFPADTARKVDRAAHP